MALIVDFEKRTKTRHGRQEAARCTYDDFIGRDGKKYLQFDTYGSTDREFVDSVSQSFRFDEQTARKLIAIIQRIFPNLR